VATVAEWDIRGMPTTANGDSGPSAETKAFAFLIHNFEITFDANGAVAENRHLCCGHESLQGMNR
jgi:hypothetical protein